MATGAQPATESAPPLPPELQRLVEALARVVEEANYRAVQPQQPDRPAA